MHAAAAFDMVSLNFGSSIHGASILRQGPSG
jgi:hypothetical protein